MLFRRRAAVGAMEVGGGTPHRAGSPLLTRLLTTSLFELGFSFIITTSAESDKVYSNNFQIVLVSRPSPLRFV